MPWKQKEALSGGLDSQIHERWRKGGFHDIMNVILSFHESQMTEFMNSRIREQIFQFSRILE